MNIVVFSPNSDSVYTLFVYNYISYCYIFNYIYIMHFLIRQHIPSFFGWNFYMTHLKTLKNQRIILSSLFSANHVFPVLLLFWFVHEFANSWTNQTTNMLILKKVFTCINQNCHITLLQNIMKKGLTS